MNTLAAVICPQRTVLAPNIGKRGWSVKQEEEFISIKTVP
jgi:hypothetical protein